MKNLIFREIWILSKAEKAGINLKFGPNVNLLIGENDVGKSTLIKSFYHCLGADTPQLNNSVWKKANAVYCVKVEICGTTYYIVRDERYFGVFDEDRGLVSRYSGITAEKGIAHFINARLGFNIQLERQANSKLGLAGPAFYFLPFYIDQDEGWSTIWSSFVGLQQFRNYRKMMIEYHLGVRPQYDQVSSQLSEVHAILSRTKENVTLSELIASEGMKEMMRSLNSEINLMIEREQVIHGKMSKNAEALRVDVKRKKDIVTWYKARMKEFLNDLNVGVLSEEDYNTLDRQIRTNALGSDLPRSLLAQYFAFLHTMKEYNSFVLCPMLIDSPFQQEQDPSNRKAILDFMLSKRLKDQQMILATISVSEFDGSPTLSDATTYRLDNKLSVLRKDQYESVLKDIGELHHETLASPG